MVIALASAVLGFGFGVVLWAGVHFTGSGWFRLWLCVLPIAATVWLGVGMSDGWGWFAVAGVLAGYLYRVFAAKGDAAHNDAGLSRDTTSPPADRLHDNDPDGDSPRP